MRVQPFLMRAPGIPTALIPGQQSPFKRGLHHAVLPAHVEWIAIVIPGHRHYCAVTAQAPNRLYRQITFGILIGLATQCFFIHMHHHLVVIRGTVALALTARQISPGHSDQPDW